MGVTTLGYPSELADPLDSAFSGLAGTAEAMTTADTATTTESTTRRTTDELTSRQPPTVAEVTAAASRSPTNVADIRNLQQYCSIEHYQSGRTKVYDSYIVKET